MPIWTAILLAAVATSFMNFGLALQKRSAAELPKIGEHPAGETFIAFMKSGLWLLGLCAMVGGWGLYLVSTKFAPISIIQPTLGVGLAVLAIFSVFYLREHIRAVEWVAFFAMLSGMVLLGVSAEEGGPPPLPKVGPLVITTLVLLGLSGLAYVLGRRGMLAGIRTDSLMGMVAGLFIGIGALFTKAMFTYLDHDYVLVGFGICLPVLIVTQAFGMIIMQGGFQRGKALVVVALEAVINKVVAIIGGMVVLAEYLPEDPTKAGIRIASFVLILFGTAALSRFGGKEVAEKLKEAAEEPPSD